MKLFNVTEAQGRRGLIDEHGEEDVYKWFHSQIRRKQQIRLCQNVGGELAERIAILNVHNHDRAL